MHISFSYLYASKKFCSGPHHIHIKYDANDARSLLDLVSKAIIKNFPVLCAYIKQIKLFYFRVDIVYIIKSLFAHPLHSGPNMN